MFFSNEINRLIFHWGKLTFSKLAEKQISRNGNLKKCPSFEEQKVLRTRYNRGNVYFGIIVFSCVWSTKLCPRFLLIYFAQEIKGFYQSSLENQVDSRDIMNVSPNILAKHPNFKKLRHRFVDENTLITMTLTSSCHFKTLVHFCLQNKSTENVFFTLNSELW